MFAPSHTYAVPAGTTQYDWFFNEDHTTCVVRETYRDSDAALEHVANLGPTLAAIFSVSDLALEIYGSPSDQLRAAIAGLAPKIYSPFQSL